MKSVLISIQPKWCEKITQKIGTDFYGKPKYLKRLDLRKTAPKPPFRAYIYCTKDNAAYVPSRYWWKADETGFQHIMNGKVIGEFICDYVLGHCEMANADIAEEQGCVPREDILKYSNGKEVFGWHISDLVIYDKPKELSEFHPPCIQSDSCPECRNYDSNTKDCRQITRPFQSWGYVRELG